MKLVANRKALAAAIAATVQDTQPWDRPSAPWHPYESVTDEDLDKYAAEVKKDRPIYSKLLLRANAKVEIVGQDKNTCLSLAVGGCRIEEPGAALLRPEMVGKMLAAVPDDEITIESASGELRFTCERSQFTDDADDPSAFASQIMPKPDATCVVQAADLLRQFTLVPGAALRSSDCNPRFTAMNGVQLFFADPFVVFATNGNRLAYSSAQAQHTGKTVSPIATTDSLRSVFALLGKEPQGTVTITANAAHLGFETERARMVTCQMQGAFPKWREHVPSGHKGCVRMKAGLLLQMLRQTKIMTNNDHKAVVFTFAQTHLEMRTQSEYGKALARETLLCHAPHVTRANGKDLILVLEKLPREAEIVLRYKDKQDTLLVDYGKELQFVSLSFQKAAA